MTPKEKAEELFGRYKIIKWYDKDLMSVQTVYSEKERTKQCALIAVEEILEVIYYEGRSEYIYWQEVKQEIEKL